MELLARFRSLGWDNFSGVGRLGVTESVLLENRPQQLDVRRRTRLWSAHTRVRIYCAIDGVIKGPHTLHVERVRPKCERSISGHKQRRLRIRLYSVARGRINEWIGRRRNIRLPGHGHKMTEWVCVVCGRMLLQDVGTALLHTRLLPRRRTSGYIHRTTAPASPCVNVSNHERGCIFISLPDYRRTLYAYVLGSLSIIDRFQPA